MDSKGARWLSLPTDSSILILHSLKILSEAPAKYAKMDEVREIARVYIELNPLVQNSVSMDAASESPRKTLNLQICATSPLNEVHAEEKP